MIVIACQVVLAVAGLFGLYQAIIALPLVGGLLPPLELTARRHRFAVLVFARNEEVVIGRLLASLRAQDYPSEQYEIFVTADNCTDETAAVARSAGATVLERHDEQRVGKGHALTWFFDRFDPHGFDACVVFDADNVADPGFLAAMNSELNAGHPIATGYRMGKNPSASWVAGGSTLFWLMQTRLFHLPRARRGLPCVSVGGTGFMFALSVLDGRGWRTESACEDIEFTLSAIAAGHFVAYTPWARYYDEQPTSFAHSLRQRYRWAVGSLQVVRLCTPSLAGAVLRDWRIADALVFSVGALLSGLAGLAWVVLMLAGALQTGEWNGLFGSLAVSATVGYVALAGFAWLVLRLEQARWRGDWLAVAMFPLYLLSWSALQIVTLFYRDPRWVPIPHTDTTSIDDLNAQLTP